MNAQKFNSLLLRINTDASAMEELHNHYFPKIVFKYISYSTPIAEDIAQEFFLKLLKMVKGQIAYIEYPTTWVYAVCNNIANTKQKNNIKKVNIDDEYVQRSHTELQTGKDSRIDEFDINHMLSILDGRQRKYIIMKFWDGYSNKEIAASENINISNVRQILCRAIKKLKKIM